MISYTFIGFLSLCSENGDLPVCLSTCVLHTPLWQPRAGPVAWLWLTETCLTPELNPFPTRACAITQGYLQALLPAVFICSPDSCSVYSYVRQEISGSLHTTVQWSLVSVGKGQIFPTRGISWFLQFALLPRPLHSRCCHAMEIARWKSWGADVFIVTWLQIRSVCTIKNKRRQ